jgi:hypothetical protein
MMAHAGSISVLHTLQVALRRVKPHVAPMAKHRKIRKRLVMLVTVPVMNPKTTVRAIPVALLAMGHRLDQAGSAPS